MWYSKNRVVVASLLNLVGVLKINSYGLIGIWLVYCFGVLIAALLQKKG